MPFSVQVSISDTEQLPLLNETLSPLWYSCGLSQVRVPSQAVMQSQQKLTLVPAHLNFDSQIDFGFEPHSFLNIYFRKQQKGDSNVQTRKSTRGFLFVLHSETHLNLFIPHSLLE